MQTQDEALRLEWATLQGSYEAYENGAIAIKLAALAAFLYCASGAIRPQVLIVTLPLIWFVEAMYRTYQSRLGQRIERIEAALAGGEAVPACQLHSAWRATRPGFVGLLAEYARTAVRPGVAFPHAVLLFLLVLVVVLP